MRINTNLTALGAARNLGTVQNAIAKSSEKLSSGFRINHASDDAAGLGVANTLASDVRAYTQASSNAEQAQAVFNIAEGATNSIVSMLQRMKELAVQSASDTVDANARTRADGEFQALQQEIARTIQTAKFQGNVLLAGGYGSTDTGTAKAAAGVASVNIGAAAAATYTLNSVDATHVSLTGNNQAQTIGFTAATGMTLNFSSFGISVSTAGGGVANSGVLNGTTVVVAAGSGTFQVGNGATANDRISVTGSQLDVDTLTQAATLGSITSKTNAQSAITAVNTALDQTSTVLGNIGAYQSRIASALDNLKNTIQNYTAAESTIRDVNMATEMVKFSKNQVLAQAGTAVLAQANIAGQSVLKLFQ